MQLVEDLEMRSPWLRGCPEPRDWCPSTGRGGTETRRRPVTMAGHGHKERLGSPGTGGGRRSRPLRPSGGAQPCDTLILDVCRLKLPRRGPPLQPPQDTDTALGWAGRWQGCESGSSRCGPGSGLVCRPCPEPLPGTFTRCLLHPHDGPFHR